MSVEDVGSEWARNYAIDVVGISEVDNSLVLGSCHWQEEPVEATMIEDLVKKTAAIIPKDGNEWSVYYVAFSAAGWSEEAQAEAEEIALSHARSSRSSKEWHSAGVRLLDLEEVDKDLARWGV